MDADWVTLPGLFDDASVDELCQDLDAAGVPYEAASMPLESGAGGRHAWRVRVGAAQVTAAAQVLGRFFDLEDPEAARPFRGDCPACEEPVEDAWSCPSCELSFKQNVNPNDPLVVFLREHGGFVDPDDAREPPRLSSG